MNNEDREHQQRQQSNAGLGTGAKVGIGLGVIGFVVVLGLVLLVGLAFVISNSKGGEELRKKAEAEEAARLAERGANIILISIDTLRADHLGCYGGSAHTPNIDRLASQGRRYKHCFTPNPLTLPAHTSMLSGTSPLYHQVRDNVNQRVPTDKLRMLQQELGANRYQTGGFVSSAVLAKGSGMEVGFDHYDDDIGDASAATTLRERNAEDTLKRAYDWISECKEDRPYFSFIHLFDPHFPYYPPNAKERGLKPTRDFTQAGLTPNYVAEIEYVDQELGTFIKRLNNRRLAENTRIIITADHGEDLGERGEVTHGYTVYDGTTHVPLIIWDSNQDSPETIDEFVSLNDLFSSVLEMADVEASESAKAQNQGRSLFSPVSGRRLFIESHFGYLYNGWAKLRAIRSAEGLTIFSGNDQERVATSPESENTTVRDLQLVNERLDKWFATGMNATTGAGSGAHDHSGLSEADAENLGYPVDALGKLSFEKETLADSIGRVSPHKMIHAIGTQQKASMAFTSGRRATALALLDDYRARTKGDLGMLFHNFYARISTDMANSFLLEGKGAQARESANKAVEELRAASNSALAVKAEEASMSAMLSLWLLELRLASSAEDMELVKTFVELGLRKAEELGKDELVHKSENLLLKARVTIARAQGAKPEVFAKLAEKYAEFTKDDELIERIRQGQSIIAPFE